MGNLNKKKLYIISLFIILLPIAALLVYLWIEQPNFYKNEKYQYEFPYPRNAKIEFVGGDTTNTTANKRIKNADNLSLTFASGSYLLLTILTNESINPRSTLLETKSIGNNTLQIFEVDGKHKSLVIKNGEKGLIIMARQSINGPAIQENEILNDEEIMQVISAMKF